MKRIINILICMVIGHKDTVMLYDPFTGEKDLGIYCLRCHRVKICTWFYNITGKG